MPALLFVYGTLRRSPRGLHHPLLRRTRFLGNGTARGRLYDVGRYPAFVPVGTTRNRVSGELYLLRYPEHDWPRLDAHEECDDNDPRAEYRRELIDVRVPGGKSVRAWCYIYNRPVRGLRRITCADYRSYQRSGIIAAEGKENTDE